MLVVDFIILEVHHFQEPQVADQVQQGHESRGGRADVVPLCLDGHQSRAVHERHEDHLKPFRIDVVSLDLQMQQISVILGYELRKCLGAIPANDEIIEYQPFASTLLDYELLDALSFIETHLKMYWNIIAVR